MIAKWPMNWFKNSAASFLCIWGSAGWTDKQMARTDLPWCGHSQVSLSLDEQKRTPAGISLPEGKWRWLSEHPYLLSWKTLFFWKSVKEGAAARSVNLGRIPPIRMFGEWWWGPFSIAFFSQLYFLLLVFITFAYFPSGLTCTSASASHCFLLFVFSS